MKHGGEILGFLLAAVTALLLLPVELVWSAQPERQRSMSLQKPDFSWRQTDSSLALLDRGRVVWQFNFDKKQGKPYFHPVSLPDGTELTSLRPQDHPWHRALWFSWKYIDGLNYWEEDRKTGLSQGRTDIVDVELRKSKDYSAWFSMNLNYHPPGEPVVLNEKRSIKVSAPGEQGRYVIDWCSTFTTGSEDVLLDRTPVPGDTNGKSWGGYAGLSVRMAKRTSQWQFIDSEGRKDQQMHGKRARWVDFSGRIVDGRAAGITIFDHPDNLRHPTPWYIAKGMPYFSPALLFDKPYTLPAGKSLTLRYRVLIHPGPSSSDLLEREWKLFLETVYIQAQIDSAQNSGAPLKGDDTTYEKIENKSCVFQFRRDMPFAEAIEQIKYCVEPPLKIVVLWRDLLDNADIDRMTPANIDEISGVSPGTALKLLLASVSGRYDRIGYVVKDGVITVATVETLPKMFETRVYDVTDLF